ncbi:uncharacterized protein FIBRA_01601 [Fibroporia radiculosa]|uniref:Uncharacterized protein n=1 Tax=Fibroporia radiculosa TaxID=599839 RepID=J4G129_9APHY|nr:uncharacterized protein FIBRA_01601 [Fibroporia radiculosa]CCL99583.1 predicted protein [Fibroporia radiculosa]
MTLFGNKNSQQQGQGGYSEPTGGQGQPRSDDRGVGFDQGQGQYASTYGQGQAAQTGVQGQEGQGGPTAYDGNTGIGHHRDGGHGGVGHRGREGQGREATYGSGQNEGYGHGGGGGAVASGAAGGGGISAQALRTQAAQREQEAQQLHARGNELAEAERLEREAAKRREHAAGQGL